MHNATIDRPYLSLSEVARAVNAPGSRIRKAQRLGQLKPDFSVGHVHLFSRDRMPELQAILGVQTLQH